jgi:hypothetical protein
MKTTQKSFRQDKKNVGAEETRRPKRPKNLFSAASPSKIPDVVYKQLVSLII